MTKTNCNTCNTCKHWGGQGTIGTVTETEGDYRTCMAFFFGDMDNDNFKPMPKWKITYGSMNGAKGTLEVYRNYGCLNHNPEFDSKILTNSEVPLR